jgi:hypothetical protein
VRNEEESPYVIAWKRKDYRHVIARNKEGSWLVIAWKAEDSEHVIASPEGAKQSPKESCRDLIHQTRLSHLLYEIATLPSVARNDKK